MENLDRIDNEVALAQTALADACGVSAEGLTLAQAAGLHNQLTRHLKGLQHIRDFVSVCRKFPVPLTLD